MSLLQDFDQAFKLEEELLTLANSATLATHPQRTSSRQIAQVAGVAALRKSNRAFETSKWDSDLIWETLLQGEVVPVFSNVLGELIFWVWSGTEREVFAKSHPNIAIYTWEEIKALTKAKVTHEGLRKLHEAKKILGGNFVEVLGKA